MFNGLFGKVDSKSNASVKKHYLAVSRCIPIEGVSYNLQRIETDGEFFYPVEVTTSKVISINRPTDDIFIVETRNSVYHVKILGLVPSLVKLVVGYKIPKVDEKFHCFTVRDAGVNFQLISTFSSYVVSMKYVGGLYEVKTKNSLYYLMINSKWWVDEQKKDTLFPTIVGFFFFYIDIYGKILYHNIALEKYDLLKRFPGWFWRFHIDNFYR